MKVVIHSLQPLSPPYKSSPRLFLWKGLAPVPKGSRELVGVVTVVLPEFMSFFTVPLPKLLTKTPWHMRK